MSGTLERSDGCLRGPGSACPGDPTVLEYVGVRQVILDAALIDELMRVLTPMATLRDNDDRARH
jgi:hypothetical protein